MLTARLKTMAIAGLAGATLLGTVSDGFAINRYTHTRSGVRYYGHRYYGNRGYGVGPGLAAGAALGILGAATAGIAADRYYGGYPAYSYGPGYGGSYGYDYHPAYGYYGPY